METPVSVKSLISTILQPLAAKAIDKTMDKAMDMVVQKVDGIVNIRRDISGLQTTLSMIEGIVQVTEGKQFDNGFIQNWLRDLVDICNEARNVLNDFINFPNSNIAAEEASNSVNFFSSLIMKYIGGSSSDTPKLPLAILNQLEKDIRGIRERFDEKKKEGKTFATLNSVVGGGGSKSIRVDRRPVVGPYLNRQAENNLVLGRERVNVKEGIMEKLLHPSDDNRVHVVAICGMGGIGKTTLAQSIYNDERVQEDDYPTKNRSWLSVGENKFSVEKVIRKIVNNTETVGIGNLQKKLVEKLRGDRFLIILDDVWNVDSGEWDLLFSPLTHVGNGGLIMVTTQKTEVCTAINTQNTYVLEPLSEGGNTS